MKIERINSYDDKRFSKESLLQHGCFTINKELYEIRIVSNFEAIIKGSKKYYNEIIDEFRFYFEHINVFYDTNINIIKTFLKVPLFDCLLNEIQPSQFYIDKKKKEAVKTFIKNPEDIIIPLIQYGNKYISLDGHTRLKIAADRDYKKVKGFITKSDEYIYSFVQEAIKRNIVTPHDMIELSHEEYDIKWNLFCDNFFNK